MLSGDANDIVLTDSFHGTIISWARQAGAFKVKNIILPCDTLDDEMLDAKWREWARNEEIIRVVLALHIHDSQFAVMLHHEPFLRHESARLLMSSDELFAAPTARQWQVLATTCHPAATQRSNIADTETVVQPRDNTITMHDYALLSGYLAIICEAQCSNLSDADSKDFYHRLTSWYETHERSLLNSTQDTLCLKILWHKAFMALCVDFDLLDRAVGRDGFPIHDKDAERITNWVNAEPGKRCLVHAFLIYDRVRALRIGVEPAIHVPTAFFYAGCVMYCHIKFRRATSSISSVDVPELRCGQMHDITNRTSDTMRRLDSSTIYDIADLLRRHSHWMLSHKFASILGIMLENIK